MEFIYGIFIGKKCIYIGRSKNPIQRAVSHSAHATYINKAVGNQKMLEALHRCFQLKISPRFKIIGCAKEGRIEELECAFIYSFEGKLYNIVHGKNNLPDISFTGKSALESKFITLTNHKIKEYLKYQIELWTKKRRTVGKTIKGLKGSRVAKRLQIKPSPLLFT